MRLYCVILYDSNLRAMKWFLRGTTFFVAVFVIAVVVGIILCSVVAVWIVASKVVWRTIYSSRKHRRWASGAKKLWWRRSHARWSRSWSIWPIVWGIMLHVWRRQWPWSGLKMRPISIKTVWIWIRHWHRSHSHTHWMRWHIIHWICWLWHLFDQLKRIKIIITIIRVIHASLTGTIIICGWLLFAGGLICWSVGLDGSAGGFRDDGFRFGSFRWVGRFSLVSTAISSFRLSAFSARYFSNRRRRFSARVNTGFSVSLAFSNSFSFSFSFFSYKSLYFFSNRSSSRTGSIKYGLRPFDCEIQMF